jgi:uncharacterized protein (TIGR03382 family)
VIRLALALALLAGTADAFPTGTQFDLDPVANDGAGGIAFDGAPRWTNHYCDVCHTDPPHRVGLRLEADHSEVFTSGWLPGMQYHMRVVLLNEWAGAQYQPAGDNCGAALDVYSPCDQNGFALEIDNAVGSPVGTYATVVNNACASPGSMVPSDVDVRIMTDGNAVTHNGAHHAQIAWDFCWKAPSAGAGVLTAFIAAVDGNGGNGTSNFPADTVGDDVATGQVLMAEAGAMPPPPQTGGCSAGGETGAGVVIALVVLALVRRRSAALLAIASLAGCAHVRPRERETLARRNMKFSPDPIEDELDLHMQEAREGSSGGYGSSGGGCGCN